MCQQCRLLRLLFCFEKMWFVLGDLFDTLIVEMNDVIADFDDGALLSYSLHYGQRWVRDIMAHPGCVAAGCSGVITPYTMSTVGTAIMADPGCFAARCSGVLTPYWIVPMIYDSNI